MCRLYKKFIRDAEKCIKKADKDKKRIPPELRVLVKNAQVDLWAIEDATSEKTLYEKSPALQLMHLQIRQIRLQGIKL